jgi:DNA-directed RNA polymerase specialized sigma24 family protein
MSFSEDDRKDVWAGARRFATTHWSVVLRAGDSQTPHSADALEHLCSVYWYPLYAFVRNSGHEEARDLTQEFFARLLEKKWLKGVDPERGRFRTFLLASLKHFLANEWNRARTRKRGGGLGLISLDGLEAEERFGLEPKDTATPEALYQRRWAVTLIARAQDRLRDEMTAAGQADRFEALEPTLAGERTNAGYQALATRFGVAETGVKAMVSRLRRRFREMLEEEIAETLDTGQEPESELRELFAALGG